ncbi:hypothetical protein GQ54DRAFT_307019 [Martensiomyces pterosporus]|nr:hypothetical protein GQ54DRAFT_307019 [Martensiomyces pterosporus]
MAPPATRRTPRSSQHVEAMEQPAYESDQGSFQNAEDAGSDLEEALQPATFVDQTLPRVSLSDAGARIDLFTGDNPLVTARWLKSIETLYPEGSAWYADRLILAKMRLEGEAKTVIQRALPSNWEAFKQCLLGVYEPETAGVLLEEQLDDRSRYKGMPPKLAIQMAIRDRLDLRWFRGADTNDRGILLSLKVIFPPTVLTAMCFSPAGDFCCSGSAHAPSMSLGSLGCGPVYKSRASRHQLIALCPTFYTTLNIVLQ